MIQLNFWMIQSSMNDMAPSLSTFYQVFTSGKKSDWSLMPFLRSWTLNRQQKVILSWFYWMILYFKNSPKIGILIFLHAVFGKSSQKVQIFIILMILVHIGCHFLSKSKKPHFWPHFRDFWMIRSFEAKSGSVSFLPLWCPNLMPKFGNILRAVFQNSWDQLTNYYLGCRLNWRWEL